MWLGGGGQGAVDSNLRVNGSPEDAKRPLQSWSQTLLVCAPGPTLEREQRDYLGWRLATEAAERD